MNNAETRNLCAQIPLDLHQRVCEERDRLSMTTAQYITQLLLEYYEMKDKGGKAMENTRTMAFQIGEELFQRIKNHLERESARTGKRLTQRDFVLSLIETALDEAERQAGLDGQAESEEPQEGEDASPGDEADGGDD